MAALTVRAIKQTCRQRFVRMRGTEGADVHGRGVHAVRVRKCSPLTGACRPEKNGIQKVEITVFLTILRSALSSAADLT